MPPGRLPLNGARRPRRLHREEAVFDPRTGDLTVQMPPLLEGKLYPKEQALIDLEAAECLCRAGGCWSSPPIRD